MERTNIPSSEAAYSTRPSKSFALPFSERRALLITVDTLIILIACTVAIRVWTAVAEDSFNTTVILANWPWYIFSIIGWWGLFWLFDLYDVSLANLRKATAGRIVLAGLILLVAYFVLYFFAPRNVLPRWFAIVLIACMTIGSLLWRTAYASVFALTPLRQRTLIVGAGWAGTTLADLLNGHQSNLYEVIGFIDDDPQKVGTSILGYRVIGASSNLVEITRQYHISQIIVAITHDIRSEMFQALTDCEANGLCIKVMSDLYESLTRRVPIEHINNQWLLRTFSGFSPSNSVQQYAKRAVDLGFSLLGVLGLAVVFPFAAAAIKLDDNGPIFYTQSRSGLAGKPFTIRKFRTMTVNAEQDGNPQWAQANDHRVTRVGRFLRKSRIDELPQVLNVLKGEMSIVGPRPERPEFIQELERQIPFYGARLVVKPGLTGWAQIWYRYGSTVEDALMKLQYDMYYIRHQSFRMDIYIILKTIGVVLRLQGR